MRWMIVVAALSLAASAEAGDAAGTDDPFELRDLPTVRVLADVEKLPAGTLGVSVHSMPRDVMDALVTRFPDLRGLQVTHPGNNLDEGGFKQIERFKQLETLALNGDAFLYDDEFALLGRMTSLRDLRLGLP